MKLISGTASVEVRQVGTVVGGSPINMYCQIALVALAKSSTLEAFEGLLMEPFLEAVIGSPDEIRRYSGCGSEHIRSVAH